MARAGKPNTYLFLSIIFIIFAALVFFAVTRPSNTVQADKNKKYDEVMLMDVENPYPDSPDGVLDKYIEIDSFLSGNTVDKFTDGDLKILVEKQRLLLHPELLELNPLETQMEGYQDKIKLLKDNELRIMQVNTETPRFSNDGSICSIGAKQYWNDYVSEGSRTIDLVYNLKKDDTDGRWKIIGWFVNEQAEGEAQ